MHLSYHSSILEMFSGNPPFLSPGQRMHCWPHHLLTMDNLTLDIDLSGVTDADVALLQESAGRGMPEFAASCCDDGCTNSCGSCDDGPRETTPEIGQ